MDDFSENQTILQNIYIKYMTLINEFLNIAHDKLPKNSAYRHNISKGVEVLTHIFKFNILKTKNLNVTLDICHKNYLYYIEFISQISDNNNLISLTPNDAVFFVLKKSVFNTFTDVDETIEHFDLLCPFINDMISFHNELVFYYINELDIYNTHHFDLFNKNIYSITQQSLKIESLNNLKNIISYAKVGKIKRKSFQTLTTDLITFIKYITHNNVDNKNIYNVII